MSKLKKHKSVSDLVLANLSEDKLPDNLNLNLPKLSAEENEAILKVLERDIILQHQNALRQARLKNELTSLRRKGALKPRQEEGHGRSCGRCQTSFGLLLNRGAVCPSCKQRVCKQCREEISPGRDWVCVVCRKQIEIQLTTGEWIKECKKPLCNFEDRKPTVSTKKLRRSWTISSPHVASDEVSSQLSSSAPSKSARCKFQDENLPPDESGRNGRSRRRYSMSSVDYQHKMKSPEKSYKYHPSQNDNSLKRPKDFRKHKSPPVKHYHSAHRLDQSKSPSRGPSHSHSPPRVHYINSQPRSSSHPYHLSNGHISIPPNERHRVLQNHNRKPEYEQRSHEPRRMEKPDKYYFFGENIHEDHRRSSTLPREPRNTTRTNKETADEVRFHSMPRSYHSSNQNPPPRKTDYSWNKTPNQYSGIQHNRLNEENIHRFPNQTSQYYSSPNDRADNYAYSEKNRSSIHSQNHEYYPESDHTIDRRSRSPLREKPAFQPMRDRISSSSSQSSKTRVFRKLPEIPIERQPQSFKKEHYIPVLHVDSVDSLKNKLNEQRSISSIHSEEYYPKRAINIHRSKTSVSSGLSERLINPDLVGSPVKRSNSLQTRSHEAYPQSKRPEFEQELGRCESERFDKELERNNIAVGNVARFVRELEKGIQGTFHNDFKPPDFENFQRDEQNHHKDFQQYNHKNFQQNHHPDFQKDIHQDFQQDHSPASSENIEYTGKFVPDGDEYKLVFISSDSSKESDANTSIDSDALYAKRNAEIDKKAEIFAGSPRNAGFLRNEILPNEKIKTKYVDASIMTDDYGLDDEISLCDVSIATSLCYPSDSHHSEEDLASISGFNSINMDEMLQQKEAVQAEAQALQKVLLQHLDPNPHSNGSHNIPKYSDLLNISHIPTELLHELKSYDKHDYGNYSNNYDCNNIKQFNSCDNNNEYINKQHTNNEYKNKQYSNDYNNKPQFTLKEKRNVCIQTNMSEASYSDSDSSCSDSDTYYQLSDCTSVCSEVPPEDCLKGQKTTAHSPYPSTHPQNIRPPMNHLQLTLNREDLVSNVTSSGEVVRYPCVRDSVSDSVNNGASKIVHSVVAPRVIQSRSVNSSAIKYDKNYCEVRNNMNSQEKESCSDLNADKKIIPDSDPLGDQDPASSTSDEDTDEDEHVSRSYDVTLCESASSETDDPDSAKEVESNPVKLKAFNSNSSFEDIDDDKKIYLPECDQNISIIDSVDNNVTPKSALESDLENDILELAAENKSETESNLGLDSEMHENKLEINDAHRNDVSNKISAINTDSDVINSVNKEVENIEETQIIENELNKSEIIENSSQEKSKSDIASDSRVSEKIIAENVAEKNNENISPVTTSEQSSSPTEEAKTDPDEHSSDTLQHNDPSNNHEFTATEITGSAEVEQGTYKCENEPVVNNESSGKHVNNVNEESAVSEINEVVENIAHKSNEVEITHGEKALSEIDEQKKENSDQGNSTQKSPKIEETKAESNYSNNKTHDTKVDNYSDKTLETVSVKTLREKFTTKNSQPVPPVRKAKRPTEGVSSDVEKSDASDSTEAVDGSNPDDEIIKKEGNFVSIVAVGDNSPKKSSKGKIYITSDSTDSDVQIKPTCIVLTGASGKESESDCDSDSYTYSTENSDVTVLEVTSEHRKDHVMSVRVISPESSRSASPSRIDSIRKEEKLMSTPNKKETSSLANYFTVTLGSDSPALPRRTNKTPEVLRRKIIEKNDQNGATSTSPESTTPTQTPSPGQTPSPTVTPTQLDSSSHPDEFDDSFTDEYNSHDGMHENSFDNTYSDKGDDSFDAHEGGLDSIEEYESIEEANFSDGSSEEGYEREEDIRYAKRSFNFVLHTIIEESCEDSDYEKKSIEEHANNQSQLEKYFCFEIGNGKEDAKKYANEESEFSDSFSETSSSNFSEGVDSIENFEQETDPAELASSRLEKYFSGILNFERQPSIRSVGEESENFTDESGSVGSDSEGSPSPEQQRKKKFKTRGVRSVSSSRSHGYSSDKGEGVASDGSHNSNEQDEPGERNIFSGEDEGTTESEEMAFDKSDGQFDTIKRRKKKKISTEVNEKLNAERQEERTIFQKDEDNFNKEMKRDSKKIEEDPINKHQASPQSSSSHKDENMSGIANSKKFQSRDSGFIGSSDDLLKDKGDENTKENEAKESPSSESGHEDEPSLNTHKSKEATDEKQEKNCENENSNKNEEINKDGKVSRSSTGSSADLQAFIQNQNSNLNRKDSFNNWSSDEETTIMMNKMRMFFKNMFSQTNSINNGSRETPKGQKVKSAQLLMFESRLTNLMRTVPGINDEQVKEIVEYLSSEDTWSDSYDSSDYTSSDLEGAYARLDQATPELQSELQKQISVSCQQIIKKFDQGNDPKDHERQMLARSWNANDDSNKETFFMYHKIMSSIKHIKNDSDRGSVGSSSGASPSLLAKAFHHIGKKLEVLMREVSASSENGDDADSFTGGSLVASSPRPKLFIHKKYKHPDSISLDSSIDKNSLTSYDSEDSPTDTENSPDSEIGTPKAVRSQRLSIISEKSKSDEFPPVDGYKTPSDTSRHSYLRKGSNLFSKEDRSGTQYDFWRSNMSEDRYDVRDHGGVSKALSRNARKGESRKSRSHLSLEKLNSEDSKHDSKNTGERAESVGDLLDRVRSAGYSSSYEQLDSDSTLRASDSLEHQIASSSSNIRLNTSSRGSLNASSRGSLAASSRGSLNASSRGSLQGSSGPEEDEEKKSKKLTFFRHTRRSNIDDKDSLSREVRSTTLPRSTPAQILPTGTLPRSNQPPSQLFANKASSSSHSEKSAMSGPRSARYHAPGYRPPSSSSSLPPKRTISTPLLKKDNNWHVIDEDSGNMESNTSHSVSMSVGSLPKSSFPSTGSLRGGALTSRASPLGGSLGRISRGSLASFDQDEEAKRSGNDRRNNSLSTLGPKSRSESMASVCSNGGERRYGSVCVMGEIRVALQYSYKEAKLECHVIQCRDLAPVDTKRNRSDPYVKAYLLPDPTKKSKRKTKVKKHTLCPVFEDVLKFPMTLKDLESRTLWLSVWNLDKVGRNDFLGEVMLPLDNAIIEDSSPKWYLLQDQMEEFNEGDTEAYLIVALRFVPPDAPAMSGIATGSKGRRSRGMLQVRVKGAANLRSTKQPHTPPNAVCKGVLHPEKGKSSKHKTGTCKKTCEPQWNATLRFEDVTLQELTEKSLELCIYNHDLFTTSEFLGGCRLNLGNECSKELEYMDASGPEQEVWKQMLEKPNLWYERSILLRTNIDRPIYSSSYTE